MPQPPQIPFRRYARDHVEAGQRLLEGHGSELRYACLELRLAIETLAYSTLQNYLENVDGAVDRAHDHWQPNKGLEELITYDPMADAGFKVTFLTVNGDGSVREAKAAQLAADCARCTVDSPQDPSRAGAARPRRGSDPRPITEIVRLRAKPFLP